MSDDLNKVRNRQYPQRCRKCFLIESLCRCITTAPIPVPKSGVRVRDPRRIRVAAYN